MKLIHEYEDCIVGIIVGIIIIGLSGYFFDLPDWSVAWGIIFIVSALFTIFDFFHTLSDLGNKIIPIIFIFINNFIDIILEIVLAVYFLGYSISFISDFLEPYITDPFYLLIIGIFFVVTSVFWIIATPIIWKEDEKE